MKRLYLLVSLFFLSLVAVTTAGESDPTLCAGPKACRMCHKKEAIGNQYKVWTEGPHAKAFTILASKDAKAKAAEAGIADPQKSGKCLKCHSSAYNFTEEAVVEKAKVEEGVICESCHGYGKKFKKKSIMSDKAKAVELGLIDPPTKNCTNCHNDQSPTWDPERYTTKDGKKVGFDAKLAYAKIKHPRPEKK